jgi:hypothetical protein
VLGVGLGLPAEVVADGVGDAVLAGVEGDGFAVVAVALFEAVLVGVGIAVAA